MTTETRRRRIIVLVGLISSLLIFSVVFRLFIHIVVIPTPSMDPTLPENTIAVFLKPTRNVEHEDIVLFWDADNETLLIKRIIGLPGDTLTIENGAVTRNGETLQESYAVGSTASDQTTYTVPENSVFLLGDNREDSLDARSWDDPYVSFEKIYGILWGFV